MLDLTEWLPRVRIFVFYGDGYQGHSLQRNYSITIGKGGLICEYQPASLLVMPELAQWVHK